MNAFTKHTAKPLDCGSLLPLSVLAALRPVGDTVFRVPVSYIRLAAGCFAQSGSRLPQSKGSAYFS
jgi:hypothetical protein